jgi:hypothetical protein
MPSRMTEGPRKCVWCLAVVLDYKAGQVVYVGKDRKAKTLSRFFNHRTTRQREAV